MATNVNLMHQWVQQYPEPGKASSGSLFLDYLKRSLQGK